MDRRRVVRRSLSASRRAALPVGAHSRTRQPARRAAASTRARIDVVLPMPGPPVRIERRWSSAWRTPCHWSSLSSPSGRAGSSIVNGRPARGKLANTGARAGARSRRAADRRRGSAARRRAGRRRRARRARSPASAPSRRERAARARRAEGGSVRRPPPAAARAPGRRRAVPVSSGGTPSACASASAVAKPIPSPRPSPCMGQPAAVVSRPLRSARTSRAAGAAGTPCCSRNRRTRARRALVLPGAHRRRKPSLADARHLPEHAAPGRGRSPPAHRRRDASSSYAAPRGPTCLTVCR